MNCKDCLHYDDCLETAKRNAKLGYNSLTDSGDIRSSNQCRYFIDKSRFIKLPCKIGDTVYYLATECDGCKDDKDYCQASCKKSKGFTKIKTTIIKQFHIQGNQFDNMTDTDSAWSSSAHYFYIRDIGKTVFLIKEEAERALRKAGDI